MTTEVVTFPAGVYPDVQRLTPDVSPGQSVLESTFIGAQNVSTHRGAERWKLEMQFNDLTGASRAEMMAFVARLRVAHNAFLCVNHTASNRGSLGGSPLATSHSLGQYLVVTGATASADNWARAGDFVSVSNMLKIVLQDASTVASGVASLFVWPPFPSQANLTGVAVRVSSPVGSFRALSVMPMNTDPPGYRTSISITAVERVNSSAVADFL